MNKNKGRICKGGSLYDILGKVSEVVSGFRDDPRTGLTIPIAGNFYCGPKNSVSPDYLRDHPKEKEPLNGVCFDHDMRYESAEQKKKNGWINQDGYNQLIKKADDQMLAELETYEPKSMSESALKIIAENGIKLKRWADSYTGASVKNRVKSHHIIERLVSSL